MVRSGGAAVLCAALLTALLAARAEAFAAYTGDARPGATVATVYGYVDTSSQRTAWGFAYGTTTRYGQWSSAGQISAGKGIVMVAAQLPGLKPGTTYHYVLVAIPLTSSGPDFADGKVGSDTLLSTQAEQLDLLQTTLRLTGSSVPLALDCQSTTTCSATVTVRLRNGSRSVTCAAVRVRLPAGSQRTLSPRLGGSCLSLVDHARGRTATGLVSARLSSHQLGFSLPVTVSR